MTAGTLIRDLHDNGARLIRHGDRLRIEAPVGTLTADLHKRLAEHKPTLLAYLSLREFAEADGFAAALVDSVPDADLADCAGLPDDMLRAYLVARRDDDMRRRGKVPAGDTAAVRCAHCGPVWLHPAVASVLPIVDAWPRALGCPWCHVRKRGAIPRPGGAA